jgi:hypothetical protein
VPGSSEPRLVPFRILFLFRRWYAPHSRSTASPRHVTNLGLPEDRAYQMGLLLREQKVLPKAQDRLAFLRGRWWIAVVQVPNFKGDIHRKLCRTLLNLR